MLQQQIFDFYAPAPVLPQPVLPAPVLPAPPEIPTPPLPPVSPLSVLRQRTAAISGHVPLPADRDLAFSTGCGELDTWLPAGGLLPGTIVEWISPSGGGGGSLAMIAASAALKKLPGPLVIVDPIGQFHAAAAVAWGVDPSRIIWCRPANRADTVWTIDQSLRCVGVAAVWGLIPWVFDDRDARRFQLAAQTGNTPGLMVHDADARRSPSFAAVRWHVEPLRVPQGIAVDRCRDARVLRVTLDRARGAKIAKQGEVAVTDDARLLWLGKAWLESQTQTSRAVRHETAAERLAAQLAHPTTKKRQSSERRVG